MDTFDLKSYLNNNPLLNEIKVNPPQPFSSQDMEALDLLLDGFAEGVSEFNLYAPLGETYSLEDYEDYDEDEDYDDDDDDYDYDPQYKAIKHLLTKPPLTYLILDAFSIGSAPGAPKNAYYTRVTIDRENQMVTVESPHIDEDGYHYVGWFGTDKEYYPDTVNFNEDGEYIGGENN